MLPMLIASVLQLASFWIDPREILYRTILVSTGVFLLMIFALGSLPRIFKLHARVLEETRVLKQKNS